MDWFWLMVWWFAFVMYLVVLFQIVADLFRDRQLSGWAKALWMIALIVIPFLSGMVYLIARGRGMGQRQAEQMSQARAETDAYIRTVASSTPATSPTAQVSEAKALLDSGAIDEREFAALKAKALA
ncbi:PLDc N-terminal domain-containing protein [Ruania sp. N2-46]|uniref:PLDc N-terminal domain-containing protein n=2 Tax=Occultella gossypii TaxID=2800820 RepID=A0ABS7SAG0_9MICO|nr:PLDc N-terminal domain-containing protein [Occultella gossypii]